MILMYPVTRVLLKCLEITGLQASGKVQISVVWTMGFESFNPIICTKDKLHVRPTYFHLSTFMQNHIKMVLSIHLS